MLGVLSGRATVLLGGPAGEPFEVGAGDVLVLPAGTGHRRIDSSPDLLVAGAYPRGQHWDLRRGDPAEHDEVLANIAAVALPDTDPVLGADGPLIELWALNAEGAPCAGAPATLSELLRLPAGDVLAAAADVVLCVCGDAVVATAPQEIVSSSPSRAWMTSLPEPPVTVSWPAPGVMSSLPAPPEMVSSPAPPRMVSLPEPPNRKSSPVLAEEAVVARGRR